jgi:tRNA (cmo5U34)-methyltransferase
MQKLDTRVYDWNNNKLHIESSEAITSTLLSMIPVHKQMTALEYGIGTGMISFKLKDKLGDIVIIDPSKEMVKIAHDKIMQDGVKNVWPICLDLEEEYFAGEFGLIYNQLLFHHLNDIDFRLQKFYSFLRPGGYLAIADIYEENGTFQEQGFPIHRGLNVEKLSQALEKQKFTSITHKRCFTICRENDLGEQKEYPIFLLVGKK